MKVEKIQIAKCKVCQGIIMASVFPLLPNDNDVVKEFKELSDEGYEIEVIPNPEKLNWCSCDKLDKH